MTTNKTIGLFLLATTFLSTPAAANTVFNISNATETEYDFMTYAVSENGTLLPVYKKMTFLPDNFSSSGNTTWRETSTGGENTVSILTIGKVTRYFAYDITKQPLYKERQTNLTGNIQSDFININSSEKNGGALYNAAGNVIDSINGDFIGNKNTSSGGYGGAIDNEGYIKEINGNFIANAARSGGAVYNTGTIDAINGSFIVNDGYDTGEIVYNNGTIGTINGDFIGNYNYKSAYVDSGTAIFNKGKIEEINSNFIGISSLTNSGGALFNNKTIGKITGDFIYNIGLSGTEVYGGAVDNFSNSTIEEIHGNFIGNYANAGFDAIGGALSTRGTINDINSDFFANYATSSRGNGKGGAVYFSTSISNISGSFVDNYVKTTANNKSALGGAVFGRDNLLLSSAGKTRFMSGNYTSDLTRSKNYNAIFVNLDTSNKVPVITFDTTGGGSWIVNDSIEGGKASNKAIDYTSQYALVFKGDGVLNENGLTNQYISINNDVINAGEVTVEGTTLRFGAYQHEDKTANNWDGHGRFLAALKADGTADLDAEAVTSLSLNNAAFDLYNKYQDTVNLKGWKASGNSFLHVDVDVENLTADMLNINGNVEGTTRLVLYPTSDKDIRGESILFAQSQNDTIGNADSFKVWRVYRSPYMFETKYTKTGENANQWELEMNDTANDYAGVEPGERPDPEVPDLPDIPDLRPHPMPAPGGKAEVAPEVIGYQSVTAAAVAQNANLIYNVMNKVTDNRLYCPGCGFYDYYWNGEAFHNLWVNPVYTSLSIKSPTEIDADVWGIEAGGDLQHDLNNKLGLFVSYRKGSYDMNGDGKHYYSTVGSEIDIDSYLAGLYYRYDRNNWYAFATLYGGIQQADIKTDDGIKSDTDGVEFGASLEAGYDYNLTDTVYLTPSLGVFYTQVNYDDATDSVGKKAEYNDLKQIELEAGVKLTKAFRLDEGYANVYVKPSVVQTIVDGDEVTITGLGKVNTLDDETLGRIEFGGRYGFTDQLSAYGWANYTFGSDYDATTVGLGLNYAF